VCVLGPIYCKFIITTDTSAHALAVKT